MKKGENSEPFFTSIYLKGEPENKNVSGSVTEDRLINRCKDNDWAAQKELYNKYAPKMMGVCLKYLKNRETAEDALQEGFMTVFTKIGTFRHQGSFEGWMRRIFVNISCDYLRKGKNLVVFENLEDSAPFTDNELNALEKLERDELMETISELPDHYRAVLTLRAIEGYTFEEIAVMLKTRTAACKSTYYRARHLFGDLLRSKHLI